MEIADFLLNETAPSVAPGGCAPDFVKAVKTYNQWWTSAFPQTNVTTITGASSYATRLPGEPQLTASMFSRKCSAPNTYGVKCDVTCLPASTCSGHGSCLRASGNCSCDVHWFGSDCNKQAFPKVSVSKALSTSGGSLKADTISLTIPAGALDVAANISLDVYDASAVPLPSSQVGRLTSRSPVVKCGPAGQRFNVPVPVAIQFNATGSNSANMERAMRVWTFDDDAQEWVKITFGAFDTMSGTVSGLTTHFSFFTVMEDAWVSVAKDVPVSVHDPDITDGQIVAVVLGTVGAIAVAATATFFVLRFLRRRKMGAEAAQQQEKDSKKEAKESKDAAKNLVQPDPTPVPSAGPPVPVSPVPVSPWLGPSSQPQHGGYQAMPQEPSLGGYQQHQQPLSGSPRGPPQYQQPLPPPSPHHFQPEILPPYSPSQGQASHHIVAARYPPSHGITPPARPAAWSGLGGNTL